jgi:hypothetical protein
MSFIVVIIIIIILASVVADLSLIIAVVIIIIASVVTVISLITIEILIGWIHKHWIVRIGIHHIIAGVIGLILVIGLGGRTISIEIIVVIVFGSMLVFSWHCGSTELFLSMSEFTVGSIFTISFFMIFTESSFYIIKNTKIISLIFIAVGNIVSGSRTSGLLNFLFGTYSFIHIIVSSSMSSRGESTIS